MNERAPYNACGRADAYSKRVFPVSGDKPQTYAHPLCWLYRAQAGLIRQATGRGLVFLFDAGLREPAAHRYVYMCVLLCRDGLLPRALGLSLGEETHADPDNVL